MILKPKISWISWHLPCWNTSVMELSEQRNMGDWESAGRSTSLSSMADRNWKTIKNVLHFSASFCPSSHKGKSSKSKKKKKKETEQVKPRKCRVSIGRGGSQQKLQIMKEGGRKQKQMDLEAEARGKKEGTKAYFAWSKNWESWNNVRRFHHLWRIWNSAVQPLIFEPFVWGIQGLKEMHNCWKLEWPSQ